MTRTVRAGHLIVGGGPAGLAVLLAASRHGQLEALLQAGVVIVEREDEIGCGRLGRYAINSDSSAETFLSCIAGSPEPALAALIDHPAARAMLVAGPDAVPLRAVAELMRAVGRVLAAMVRTSLRGRVMTGHAALGSRQIEGGGWRTRVRCLKTGVESEIVSSTVLIATGGHQPARRLHMQPVAGAPLLPTYADRLLQSDVVLGLQGPATAAARIGGLASPRIVIVGGSTSAVSCVGVLLGVVGADAAPGSITLMHRNRLKLFFASADAARSDGYDAFGADDICPSTGFVFRCAGLRHDSRRLLMGPLGIGGAVADPRIALHRMGVDDLDRQALDGADLIVAALGYRPLALPIFDPDGDRIVLRADLADGGMVGENCVVLDREGRELAGLYGIGLAAGFRLAGPQGGEPSFRGQMNGLWLWQNTVGLMVANRMLDSEASGRHAGRPAGPPLARFAGSPAPPRRPEPLLGRTG